MKSINIICYLFIICFAIAKAKSVVQSPQNFYYLNTTGIYVTPTNNNDDPYLVTLSTPYRGVGEIIAVDSQYLYAVVVYDYDQDYYISVDLQTGETKIINQITYLDEVMTGPLWGYSLDSKKNELYSLSPTSSYHFELLISNIDTQVQTNISCGSEGSLGPVNTAYDQSNELYYAIGQYLKTFRLYIFNLNTQTTNNFIINGLVNNGQTYNIVVVKGQPYIFINDKTSVYIYSLNVNTHTATLKQTIVIQGGISFLQTSYNSDQDILMFVSTNTDGGNPQSSFTFVNTDSMTLGDGFTLNELITSYSLIYAQ